MSRSFLNTLSGRFLGLMAVFVLIAEAMIFVPAVSRFRVEYLQSRLELAQLGALALLAAPDAMVGPDLETELLATAGVYNVVLRRAEVRELVLAAPEVPSIDARYDLRMRSDLGLMRDAVAVFFAAPDRTIAVIGQTQAGAAPSDIEITLPEEPLREALVAYGLRILGISLVLVLATAGLLFLAVRTLIVRPIGRVVAHMVSYRDDPEDPSRIIEPAGGAHELAEAEAALRDLQLRLTGALRQKERLAALGAAVAKISHDLRNMLTTAQLLADRLEASDDPAVRRNAPKLVGSLGRAVALCERTLSYGGAEEPPARIERFGLAALVEEVAEAERLVSGEAAAFVACVPEGLTVRADREQLYRVLANLMRNAAQAIAASGSGGEVRIEGASDGGAVAIDVIDSGPGLPQKARDFLFQPFRGGARRGGSGLGLAIAADLVRAQGGALELIETGQSGTRFRITLPG